MKNLSFDTDAIILSANDIVFYAKNHHFFSYYPML